MSRHLFYSLLITFIMTAMLELARPNFVTNFINVNWLFFILIASGIIALTKQKNSFKIK